jgi:hypothetical protein
VIPTSQVASFRLQYFPFCLIFQVELFIIIIVIIIIIIIIIIKLQTFQVRMYYLDDVFSVNVYTGLNNCPSFLSNTALRVPVRNVKNSLTFFVTHKISPSPRCLKASNSVCRDVDIHRQPVTVLKQILYQLTVIAHKMLNLVFVLEFY